jgi:hypothetical protein
MTGTKPKYDPESLLSGAEKAAGMTFNNSQRIWPGLYEFRRARAGEMSTDEILRIATRVRKTWHVESSN